MIISASRRTDIPAFYMDWLCARLAEGFAWVRNPRNPKQLRRVNLDPAAVDAIVFWSKNPAALLPAAGALSPYAYIVQFTLTPYGADLEPGLPEKTKVLLPCFLRLTDQLGPQRVIWRYDPILLSPTHTVAWHLEQFGEMARILAGHAARCTLSFLDDYRHIHARLARNQIRIPLEQEKRALAHGLAQIAMAHGLALDACAEALDYSAQGIGKAHCIDATLLSAVAGRPIPTRKDPAQRPGCGCAQSVDIGCYNSCTHHCLYCYANHNEKALTRRLSLYNPNSPILCDTLEN